MGLDPVSSILASATTILGKFFPDADEKMKEKFTLITQQLQIEAQRALAQTDINKIEASNPSIFVAGWRPACGWACTFGLVYSFLLQPFLTWISGLIHVSSPPTLDSGPLMALLTALLGVGGMRTFEKINGVETTAVSVKPPTKTPLP